MRRHVRAWSVGSVILFGVAGEPSGFAEEPAAVEIAFRDGTAEAGLEGVVGTASPGRTSTATATPISSSTGRGSSATTRCARRDRSPP
jgi:hypothetical protein